MTRPEDDKALVKYQPPLAERVAYHPLCKHILHLVVGEVLEEETQSPNPTNENGGDNNVPPTARRNPAVIAFTIFIVGWLLLIGFSIIGLLAYLVVGKEATTSLLIGIAAVIGVGVVGAFLWFFPNGKVKGWIIATLLLAVVVTLVVSFWPENSGQAQATTAGQIPIEQQVWKYTWTIAEGVSRNGYDSMTHDVVVNELTPNLMDFTLLYRGGAEKRECHFRWDKSTGNRGNWYQAKPWSEGTFVLNQVKPGLYTGTSYGEGPKGEAMMFIELRRVE